MIDWLYHKVMRRAFPPDVPLTASTPRSNPDLEQAKHATEEARRRDRQLREQAARLSLLDTHADVLLRKG